MKSLLFPNIGRSFLLALTVLIVAGCGSGSDSPDALAGDYDGLWDARYNLTVDECGVVEPGGVGFIGRHIITQEDAITLDSGESFPVTLSGNLDPDQSFTTTGTFTGNYYGDGIPCTAVQTIAYTPQDADTVTTTFVRQVQCDDGFTCESRAVGTSTRVFS